ncbi:unnamed protein product [Caenorhabditis auriculariae]|uniref:GST N-terminal domain-containing protein n=1 Tax=Caenorhabditis auriculariae TaxID=2777116 RepID=A0A8S1HE45_9PELO|nr:unnamed protein product [Caenorhabditis auriculariae]
MAPLAGFFTSGSTEKTSESKRTCPIQVLKPEQSDSGVLLSRKIVNHLDRSNLQLRLYQYETCPFCCKVRAFLDYYGFSYDVVEVNPVTRTQIKFSKDYKKVPILTCKDRVISESSLIVSQLATYLHRPDRSLEEILEMYPTVESTDEKGKKITTHPNKYFVMLEKGRDQQRNGLDEGRKRMEGMGGFLVHPSDFPQRLPYVGRVFGDFPLVAEWDRNFPAWERILAVYVGALAMFGLSKRLKKRHGIEDERKALEEACEKWMQAIGPSRRFMGGAKPNLADLALFGAMNSFYGCRAFKEVILKGKIAVWWSDMKSAVENHEGRTILEARSKGK